MGSGGTAHRIIQSAAQAGGSKDAWLKAANEIWPGSFNVAVSPYDVWGGRYKALRPRGATFLHPEGIDAAWNKAQPSIWDEMERLEAEKKNASS